MQISKESQQQVPSKHKVTHTLKKAKKVARKIKVR